MHLLLKNYTQNFFSAHLFWLSHCYSFILIEKPNSCLILCNPMDCSPPGSSVHGILQARILEWVAILSPGIFPTQGSNPGLPHCRWILYCLSHHENPSYCYFFTLIEKPFWYKNNKKLLLWIQVSSSRNLWCFVSREMSALQFRLEDVGIWSPSGSSLKWRGRN